MKRNFLLLIGLFLIFIIYSTIYLLMPIKSKHNLKIPSSKEKLIEYLKNNNYSINIIDKVIFVLYPPYKGYIYINKTKLPRYKFLIALSKKANYYIPFTIIPGETTYFVLKNLKKRLNYNINALVKSYKKLRVFKEGNFIANTYNLPTYFNEEDSIKFLIKKSFKIHNHIMKKYNLELDSYKKFLIIASIIQKEAANKKEMPLISSVIYNRLKNKMKLQMDGALNYGRYSHTKVTPQRIKKDLSYYNTYKYRGIPKEPVCNVSLKAIKAALNPAKTNYLYFMKKDNKSHNFSTTFKEHKKNILKRRLNNLKN